MVANFNLNKALAPLSVDRRDDVEIGFEQSYDGLNIVVAEKDLWYFKDDVILVDVVDHEDEISYIINNPLLTKSEAGYFKSFIGC